MIFGERTTKIKSDESVVTNCQSCQKENAVHFKVFQIYNHILFVPWFSSGKYAVSECTSCGEILNEENMPTLYQEKAEIAKKSARTPIWVYVGLPVVIFILYQIILQFIK